MKSTSDDAVLFAKVYDVGPGGGPARCCPPSSSRPSGSRAPRPARTSPITLPAIDHEVDDGHRLRLVLASTDLGYASPTAPATYTVSLKGDLSVPSALGDSDTARRRCPPGCGGCRSPAPRSRWPCCITGRRRTAAPAPPDPALAEVPLQITDLTKRYAKSADRYAVKDLSFRVEKGQVLGLLGPNGAGKTTTLRMLMGLIKPDGGEIRVFGHAISPGAPVLSRVGAFVEGAGFLPHLSGRENLELYWRPPAAPPRTPTWTRPWRSRASATRSPARCAPTPRACASAWPSPRPCSACLTCSSSTSRPTASTRPRSARCAR